MQEFHRRVTSVTPVPHTLETTSATVATDTLIPLTDSGDFTEAGGHVRRQDNGVIHVVVGMDEGDVSGVPSITLEAPGLLTDLPAESILEEWNDETETVVTDWLATVTDEVDGSSNTAYLTHTLIGMIASGISIVGASVTVRVGDDGIWWVTEIHGATPGYDPGFIRTGGLGADTVVWAGTEDGRRAQLDGIDGALECFDSSNVQTVNLDGEDNYIEGTLATAASGSRIELGPNGGAHPANEVRFHSGHADETAPGLLYVTVNEVDPGFPQGQVTLNGQTIDGQAGTLPSVVLLTSSADVGSESWITIDADRIRLTPTTVVEVSTGTIAATMGTGSVGTGTFRDSVDARVTAVAPGAVPAASETTAGKAELATQAEVNTGTDDARIVTPLKLATYVPAASATAAGKVELATDAETITGTDTTRAVTPANVAARDAAMGHIERSADGTQSITTAGSGTVALWQDNIVAGRGGVSYSAGVFTIATAGTYTISASVGLAANATGTRIIALRRNGADIARADSPTVTTAGLGWSATVGQTIDCAASDTIDVLVYQNSGSSLAVSAPSYISIHRVA